MPFTLKTNYTDNLKMCVLFLKWHKPTKFLMSLVWLRRWDLPVCPILIGAFKTEMRRKSPGNGGLPQDASRQWRVRAGVLASHHTWMVPSPLSNGTHRKRHFLIVSWACSRQAGLFPWKRWCVWGAQEPLWVPLARGVGGLGQARGLRLCYRPQNNTSRPA